MAEDHGAIRTRLVRIGITEALHVIADYVRVMSDERSAEIEPDLRQAIEAIQRRLSGE